MLNRLDMLVAKMGQQLNLEPHSDYLFLEFSLVHLDTGGADPTPRALSD
jgi:hypothetical protein